MAESGDTLSAHLLGLFREAKDNREPIEKKWNRNHAAMEADPDAWDKCWKSQEKTAPWKSRTFLDVIRQKITAAYSLGTDTMFKGNKVPFALTLDDAIAQGEVDEEGESLVEAEIGRSEDLIQSQMEYSNATHELSLAWLSGATFGESIVKSFTTTMSKTHYTQVDPTLPGLYEEVTETRDTKGIEYKSVWNIWRDIEVEDIQEGQYIFERVPASKEDIHDLRKVSNIPGSIKEAIEAAPNTESSTGKNDSETPPAQRTIQHKRKNGFIIEAWARVPIETVRQYAVEHPDVEIELPEVDEEIDESGQTIEVYAVLANEKMVRLVVDPPGGRPYFRVVWEDTLDGIMGRSIADNMERSQVVINGIIRSIEDNTKLIANLIMAVNERFMEDPEEIQKAITEGRTITLTADCKDARQAIQQVTFQDITGSLYTLLEYFMQFADMASNIPRIEQGKNQVDPRTAYEIQQRLEAAGKYIGGVLRRFDKLIQWVAQQFYDYNMRNPSINEAKGAYVVKALGFSSFESRFIRLNKLMQALNLALSNEQLTDMTRLRWMYEEIIKALDLDPDDAMTTREEMEANQQQRMQAQQEQMAMDREAAALSMQKTSAEIAKISAEADKEHADILNDQRKTAIDEAEVEMEIEKAEAGIV